MPPACLLIGALLARFRLPHFDDLADAREILPELFRGHARAGHQLAKLLLRGEQRLRLFRLLHRARHGLRRGLLSCA